MTSMSYDVLIVGGGAAGLGLPSSRYRSLAAIP